MNKNGENRTSFEFLSFSMSIRDIFHLKSSYHFFTKHTGQPDLFNVPIHGVCRSFDRNCLKTLKKGKFWVFGYFRCHFETFCIRITAMNSSEKPTGQQYCFLLTNIPIHEVCRKFDKSCIKTLKIGIILVFCHSV